MLSYSNISRYTSPWDTALNTILALFNTGKQDYNQNVPIVGQHIGPDGVITGATGAPTVGTQWFSQITIGPAGWTASSILASITTVYAGAPTLYVGIYPTDSTTGYPLTTNGPLGQGTVATTATGIKTVAFASAVALPSGKYWLSSLVAGTVTTAGAIATIATTAAPAVGLATTVTPATPTRGLSLTGQTTLKATATAASSFAANVGTIAPWISLLRSA